jgi:hypothetical protein
MHASTRFDGRIVLDGWRRCRNAVYGELPVVMKRGITDIDEFARDDILPLMNWL